MNWWQEINPDWSLFLDRDGVINVRKPGAYVTHPDEFEFLPGVLEALAYFTNKFNYRFVVTNQQGIAKGIMTERNLLDVHDYMCNVIETAGGKLTRCYFAPEAAGSPEGLRKPQPGMGLLAKKDFPEVDFARSVMVGDTDSDIIFGRNLGMKTIRVRTWEPIGVEADLTVNALIDLKNLWEK